MINIAKNKSPLAILVREKTRHDRKHKLNNHKEQILVNNLRLTIIETFLWLYPLHDRFVCWRYLL